MRVTKSRASLSLMVLATLVSGAQLAVASPVTWEFAGEISTVYDPRNQLDGAVVTGSPFSGSFTFESTTPDSFPDVLDHGSYLAITAASGQVSGISYSSQQDELWGLSFFDNISYVSSDRVDGFGARIGIVSTSSPVSFFRMRLFATDQAGVIFEDASIPLFPPDLDRLDTKSFILEDRLQNVWVRGEMTLLVPEPTSLILFSLVGIGACRRTRGQGNKLRRSCSE